MRKGDLERLNSSDAPATERRRSNPECWRGLLPQTVKLLPTSRTVALIEAENNLLSRHKYLSIAKVKSQQIKTRAALVEQPAGL
jgi:hypothetical protein